MKQHVRLLTHQSKLLASLPEQGMGYHVVDIELSNGRILKKLFVIDSSILVIEKDEEPVDPKNILSIKLHL